MDCDWEHIKLRLKQLLKRDQLCSQQSTVCCFIKLVWHVCELLVFCDALYVEFHVVMCVYELFSVGFVLKHMYMYC